MLCWLRLFLWLLVVLRPRKSGWYVSITSVNLPPKLAIIHPVPATHLALASHTPYTMKVPFELVTSVTCDFEDILGTQEDNMPQVLSN
jgi:hypothetical protein